MGNYLFSIGINETDYDYKFLVGGNFWCIQLLKKRTWQQLLVDHESKSIGKVRQPKVATSQ